MILNISIRFYGKEKFEKGSEKFNSDFVKFVEKIITRIAAWWI